MDAPRGQSVDFEKDIWDEAPMLMWYCFEFVAL